MSIRLCIACGAEMLRTEDNVEHIIADLTLCPGCSIRSEENVFLCEVIPGPGGLLNRGERGGWISRALCPRIDTEIVILPPLQFDLMEDFLQYFGHLSLPDI